MKPHLKSYDEDSKVKQLIAVIAGKIRLKRTTRIDQTLALVKAGAVTTKAIRVKLQ
jgi:hypothetical protein